MQTIKAIKLPEDAFLASRMRPTCGYLRPDPTPRARGPVWPPQNPRRRLSSRRRGAHRPAGQDGLGRRSSCAGGRTGPAAAGRRTSGLGAGWAGSRCPRKRLSPERVCPRHKASREHTGRRNNARVSAWTLLGRSWVNRHQDPSPLRAPRLTCRCLPLAGSDSRPAGLPSGLGAGATVTERKKRPGHRGLPSSKRHPT